VSDPQKKQVRVIQILPVLEPAGAERIVAELATRLPEHGFSTSVLCMEDEQAVIGRLIAAAGIPVAGLRLSRRRSVACARAIAERLPADRPLILHSHLFHANLAVRLAVKRLQPEQRADIHVVSTVHVAERRFRPWHFSLDRLTAPLARVEVCVSHAVEKYQRERTGLAEKFFRVIENGIDLDRFKPVDISAGPLQRPPRVVSVGRLSAQKDFPTLLRAWRIVEATRADAGLVIAGSGGEEANLKALAKSLRLKNVAFPGFVENIPELLSRADVYAQPSAWEGFGLTVAEAMATGLPVVVSDADSLPELVAHDRTGWVVLKEKAEPLAKAILKLINDRVLARRLAVAAREEATARFSVDRMVAEYAALYRELLGR
jgi:glycosyltransferase involved in cell wall biosynthesis